MMKCKLCSFDLGAGEGMTTQVCDACELDVAQDQLERETELAQMERALEEYEREERETARYERADGAL